MPKSSPVWSYFEQFSEGDTRYGLCKTCQATYKVSSGSTTSLLNHIKLKHNQSYLEFREKRPKVTKNESMVNVNEQTLTDVKISEQDSEKESSFDLLFPNESENIPIKRETKKTFEKIVISGEDFSVDAADIFKDLANDLDFTNVTIVTDGGKTIKAHKVVLGAFSPFFKSLLINNPHQHPLLYIRGVQWEDMRAILDFIYLGQTKVDMEKVNEFMELAKDLQIKGLTPSLDSEIGPDDSEEMGNDSNNMRSVKQMENSIQNRMTTDEPAIQFICHLCEYTNISRKKMIDHMEEKHSISLTCYLCDYTCHQKIDLRNHMQIMHTDGIYSCNQCEFFSDSKDGLSEHIVNNHSVVLKQNV